MPDHEKNNRKKTEEFVTDVCERAGAERRDIGGEAGLAKLKEYGISDIPSWPFENRGLCLYEYAYILRLLNRKDEALQKFDESAKADFEWSSNPNNDDAPRFRAKAAMSIFACAAYEIDIAIFEEEHTNLLKPKKSKIQNIIDKISPQLKMVKEIHDDYPMTPFRKMINQFLQNGILHLAEAEAWIGNEEEVYNLLKKKRKLSIEAMDFSEKAFQLATALAEGSLCYFKKEYEKAADILKTQYLKMADTMKGEVSGKNAAILISAYLQMGKIEPGKKVLQWLLSKDCKEDMGNGLAIEWARRIEPIN